MTNEELAALKKRARKGAARTGQSYEVILANIMAEVEGRRRGELFVSRESYYDSREEERRNPRRGRRAAALSQVLAIASMAAGAPVLPPFDFTPRAPRRGFR